MEWAKLGEKWHKICKTLCFCNFFFSFQLLFQLAMVSVAENGQKFWGSNFFFLAHFRRQIVHDAPVHRAQRWRQSIGRVDGSNQNQVWARRLLHCQSGHTQPSPGTPTHWLGITTAALHIFASCLPGNHKTCPFVWLSAPWYVYSSRSVTFHFPNKQIHCPWSVNRMRNLF
jgi:hypothetical protein